MIFITENEGPCVNCICRPICSKKRWGKIIIDCRLFSDWAIKICNMDDCKKGIEVYYDYTPLNKQFNITKSSVDGKVYFGKGRYYE